MLCSPGVFHICMLEPHCRARPPVLRDCCCCCCCCYYYYNCGDGDVPLDPLRLRSVQPRRSRCFEWLSRCLPKLPTVTLSRPVGPQNPHLFCLQGWRPRRQRFQFGGGDVEKKSFRPKGQGVVTVIPGGGSAPDPPGGKARVTQIISWGASRLPQTPPKQHFKKFALRAKFLE